MRYLPNAPGEDQALLEAIGVPRAESLLGGIPSNLLLNRGLALPNHRSELEVLRDMQVLPRPIPRSGPASWARAPTSTSFLRRWTA